MRSLFFILLFVNQFSFAQETVLNTKDELLGTWWLNAVQVENFVDNSTDKITSGIDSDYALEITDDSVFFRNPELRYYKRPDEGFTYSISYDSIFKLNVLHLFSGKGKHRRARASYTFKLVNDELILNSSYEPDPNFDMLIQTNYYTYSRSKDEEHFYEKISGDWICTLVSDFVYSESTDTIRLTKKTFPDTYSDGYLISFSRDHGESKLSYGYSYTMSSSDGTGIQDGVYVKFDSHFIIHSDQKKLIIGDGDRKTIFKIIELTDEKMTLLRYRD